MPTTTAAPSTSSPPRPLPHGKIRKNQPYRLHEGEAEITSPQPGKERDDPCLGINLKTAVEGSCEVRNGVIFRTADDPST